MKSKILKGLLFIVAGYALIALLYFAYLESGGGRIGGYEYRMAEASVGGYARDKAVLSNYASVVYQQAAGGMAVDQKYEKVATLNAASERYEEDEKRTRSIITEHNALIQEEAVSGGGELRWLSLTIGVPPERFDAVVVALRLVGKTKDFQITKTDKTNDFLELRAKRATLEKSRDALVALKSQGGKIDELVKVEQEILSLEDKIQNLGVRLGQFDKVNEFCTVRFQLTETRENKTSKPHLEFALQALQWTSMFYLGLLGCLFVGLLCVILVVTIAEKVFHLSKQSDGGAR